MILQDNECMKHTAESLLVAAKSAALSPTAENCGNSTPSTVHTSSDDNTNESTTLSSTNDYSKGFESTVAVVAPLTRPLMAK